MLLNRKTFFHPFQTKLILTHITMARYWSLLLWQPVLWKIWKILIALLIGTLKVSGKYSYLSYVGRPVASGGAGGHVPPTFWQIS